jgi:hypothetical protein
MRLLRSAIVAAAILAPSLALADEPYPWCAIYDSGGTNCGFTTIDQCRATVRGVGGICSPNSFSRHPGSSARARR